MRIKGFKHPLNYASIAFSATLDLLTQDLSLHQRETKKK